MIGRILDAAIATISPTWGLRRQVARQTAQRVKRSYQGAESSRLTANKKPRNQSADQEMLGPFGADSLRAWARSLVRDNAYAWGVVDTIVSSVIGNGIKCQSVVETPDGDDVEDVNLIRDSVFEEWCEVCDINGDLTFAEIQALCQREIVEAGEVIVRLIPTRSKEYEGIYRPVPLALELIEADRLATEKDNYTARQARTNENRIVRGIELDKHGKPVAYYIYKDHPNAPYTFDRTPERVPASQIRHLFRRDRIGQTRGVSWFAPVMSWLRDLGVYVDNEIQASAVAACFTMAIKTNTPLPGLGKPDGDSVDSNGNQYDYMEPGLIMRLNPGEDVTGINTGRPNSASEAWIGLMLRGIAVGTGLSYEIVARDYSKTTYSASRTSQLEDRRRFRRWQQYMVANLCQPIWDEFCNAAAREGVEGFPTSAELLESRRKAAPVEWQTQTWEWVDPQSEQSAADMALASNMTTLSDEVGKLGGNWRTKLYQRAKEEKLRKELGLFTREELAAPAPPVTPAQQQQQAATQSGSGEWMGLSRLQWNRNRKALEDVLSGLKDGTMTTAIATAQLAMIGLAQQNIDAIIADATDGTIDNPLPDDESIERAWVTTEDGNRLFLKDGDLKTSPSGKSVADKKHSVKLPKSKSKISISQASQALEQMGYKLGKGETDLKAKKTSYEVTRPDGTKAKMTADELKDLVYEGASS